MSPLGGATRKKEIGQAMLFFRLCVLMILLFKFTTGTQSLLPDKAWYGLVNINRKEKWGTVLTHHFYWVSLKRFPVAQSPAAGEHGRNLNVVYHPLQRPVRDPGSNPTKSQAWCRVLLAMLQNINRNMYAHHNKWWPLFLKDNYNLYGNDLS